MRRVIKQLDEDLEEAYEEMQLAYMEEMQDLGEQAANGDIDPDDFEQKMQELIKAYFIALALLATDGDFDTEDDGNIEDLNLFLSHRYALLGDFTKDIRTGEHSVKYIRWRSGLYAGARHVFMRYMVPRDVFFDMPYLPGVDCLGDGWCGCSLTVIEEDDHYVVEWHLGATEHCAICLDAESGSPYTFEK
ncbi:MAG TPA: hypothetical protein PKD55_00165 [Bellilinea sp.]|nr:hypothetical protein [Bellilinea sp.]